MSPKGFTVIVAAVAVTVAIVGGVAIKIVAGPKPTPVAEVPWDSGMAATGSLVVSPEIKPAKRVTVAPKPVPRPENGLNGFKKIAEVEGCPIFEKGGIYITTRSVCSIAAR